MIWPSTSWLASVPLISVIHPGIGRNGRSEPWVRYCTSRLRVETVSDNTLMAP